MPLWLLLDSSTLTGTLLAPHALPLLGDTPPRGDSIEVTLEVLGLPPHRASVQVRELIHDGVLGASFMAQGRFTIDLRKRDAWVGVQPVADTPRGVK
jgi:hypothetical protein